MSDEFAGRFQVFRGGEPKPSVFPDWSARAAEIEKSMRANQELLEKLKAKRCEP